LALPQNVKQAKEDGEKKQPDVLQKLLANLNRAWLVDALLLT
jgi:hypothetical protein